MAQENIDTLRDCVSFLSVSDQRFAISLLDNFARWNSLTDKQWFWVRKLAVKAAALVPVKEEPDYSPIIELFDNAKQNLKRPTIVVASENGNIRLSLAGSQARFPDTINVTDARTNTWYGRIMRDGRFHEGHEDALDLSDVLTNLQNFSSNPIEGMKSSARLSSRCCLCSRKLTDERSVAAGIGPICAKNYQLAA